MSLPEQGRPDSRLIPEERVHAALRRAAQLQADAAERLEQQARARIEAGAEVESESGGFLREHVEAAAVEAGISPEYLRQALLEQDALGEHAAELAPWVDRMSHRLLGTRQRNIELSRTVDAAPALVLEAMQRIFPAHPYGMTLVDCIGGRPLEGGVLVFQLPRISMANTTGYTSFSYTVTALDLLQLHVSLRSVHVGQKVGCEITFRSDLRTSVRRNVWAGLGLSGVGGGVGAVMGVAVAFATGGLLPVAVAGAAVGVAAFGASSAAGYGVLYRHYLRKMMRELETLLKMVATSAQTGGVFRPPPPPGLSGDSDPFTLITS